MALPRRELTVDRFERQFATNYLGPFALTALLMPALRQQPGTRIVTVSSTANKFTKIDFANLQSERSYKPMFGAYSQSKLADLLFTLELQRRLTATHSPILSTAAHPGYSITNLQADHIGLAMKLVTTLLKPVLSQDAAHGALPTLFAAVAPEVKPGGYYGPGGFEEMKGYPTPAAIPRTALDLAVASRLWAESEKLTQVTFGLLSSAA